MKTRSNGFSLIEMAVVLIIIGLLLAGLMMPLSNQLDQRRVQETQKALEDASQALYGYALVNGHLPCPDKTGGAGAGTPNDGLEDVAATGACVVPQGNIPWATLGTATTDSWGNRIHYAVTPAFSDRAPLPTFALASPGTLTVCSAFVGCPATATIAAGVPAVVLSSGRNGFGAINQSGLLNPPPTGADEIANSDGNATFVSHTETATYDDLVVWLSPNTLMNRMVSGGRLP